MLENYAKTPVYIPLGSMSKMHANKLMKLIHFDVNLRPCSSVTISDLYSGEVMVFHQSARESIYCVRCISAGCIVNHLETSVVAMDL